MSDWFDYILVWSLQVEVGGGVADHPISTQEARKVVGELGEGEAEAEERGEEDRDLGRKAL